MGEAFEAMCKAYEQLEPVQQEAFRAWLQVNPRESAPLSAQAPIPGLNSHHSKASSALYEKKISVQEASLFHTLPGDTLLSVLATVPTEHLARCAATCRSWCSLVGDGTLWRLRCACDYTWELQGPLAGVLSVASWRALYRTLHTHFSGSYKGRLLEARLEAEELPRGVESFLRGICGGALPDDAGTFSYHAAQATPIHYRRGEQHWLWSADNIHWQSVSDPRPRRGIFAAAGAALVADNLTITSWLEQNNPQPAWMPPTTLKAYPSSLVTRVWPCPSCSPPEVLQDSPATSPHCQACCITMHSRRTLQSKVEHALCTLASTSAPDKAECESALFADPVPDECVSAYASFQRAVVGGATGSFLASHRQGVFTVHFYGRRMLHLTFSRLDGWCWSLDGLSWERASVVTGNAEDHDGIPQLTVSPLQPRIHQLGLQFLKLLLLQAVEPHVH